MVLSYVNGKCTTAIVVNWAKIGRSMKDRKFRVQSSLFQSLWLGSRFAHNYRVVVGQKCTVNSQLHSLFKLKAAGRGLYPFGYPEIGK
jgi:hypothetical protein